MKNPLAQITRGFVHCLSNFFAVMKNEIASGNNPPIQAIGDAKHAPKYPSHSTRKIAAVIRMTNSTMPAIVGIKLCPSPCNVNLKMNSNANAQYDIPVMIKNNRPYSITCVASAPTNNSIISAPR